jgi:hypothetical protein
MLSALRTSRLNPTGNIPGTQSLSQPLGRSADGRIVSMKESNDTIGNRTRDLPACSADDKSVIKWKLIGRKRLVDKLEKKLLKLYSGSAINCDEISEDKLDIHMTVHRDIIPNYSQQDATFLEFVYFCRRSTCFKRFYRPSSGAHNCTYSFRYFQTIMLLAVTVEEMLHPR